LAPLAGVKPPESGLGGRLVVLTPPGPPRGGCGKALMLIVFRIDFPAPFTPETARIFGRGAPPGVAGSEDVEGARNELLGILGIESERISGVVCMPPVLLRVFLEGRAGRAVVGGPKDGRDGRGREAAMMNWSFRSSMVGVS
jgi:hypothetical protein